MLVLGLALSTLLSEDAACLAAAILVRRGVLSAPEAVAACAAGIYAGDALLWAVGRAARLADASSRQPLRRCASWLRRRAPSLPAVVDSPGAILVSRFIPGTRLPLYVGAGAFGRRPAAFFFWSFVAVMAWTPLIVLGTSASLVGGLLALACVHALRRVKWRGLWLRLSARAARWSRWEFWPSALIYAPVAFHIMRLALTHRGFGTIAAANPAIPEGGFVGESKHAILAQLPARWALRADLIADGGIEARLEDLRTLLALGEYRFPLVLKPDTGQRGIGVRLIHSLDEARDYFHAQTAAVIVQEFHPGPFEAGIFYYRRPGEASGHIFSITEKRFPVLIGNGMATVEQLIWRHPRYRLQASVFLSRHAAERDRVLARGERLPLAVAGNHCQGTMFLDGAHLITPALERRIDGIAQTMPGFFIGRFDVRYSSREGFRRAEDLAIIELNGVTSESTNIYDPSFTLIDAWRVLCRQWTLTFEIGAANRAAGAPVASAARFLQLALMHLRATPALPISS